MTISNFDNIIDSRDIIYRIEELESELEDFLRENDVLLEENFPEWEELETLRALAEECNSLAEDWGYGETLIHRDYFEKYMDEMVVDCYEIPKNLPYWMSITLDYDALEQDYASVDFDGQEYLIRSC